jgi:hypothetical protein
VVFLDGWSRAAGEDLDRRSGPKTFQRKLQIDKLQSKQRFSKTMFFLVLFSITFFFNVNLSIQNTSRYFYQWYSIWSSRSYCTLGYTRYSL